MAKNLINDGYINLAAKLGMRGNNLLSESDYDASTRALTNNRPKLDAMYRSSWIIGKAIDVRGEDMTKHGIEIKSEMEPQKLDKIYRAIRTLGISNRLCDAIKWGGLYGGAIAVLLIDGQDMSEPLDLDTIGEGDFKGLRVYSRWEVTPSQSLITEMCAMEGYPEYYIIDTGESINENEKGSRRIHYSRCIRFIGIELPYYERINTLHWGASLIERWYDRLCAYDSATLGGANLMFKSYLRVLKIDNFREILASGGSEESALAKSVEYMRMFESNEGVSIIDGADDFQTYNWTFSGISEALLSFAEQIAGAIETPLIRLLGQSPSGLNSTGEADLEMYYGGIETKQNDDLRPAWDIILPVLEASIFGSRSVKVWDYDFKPLWTMKEDDKATIANTDLSLISQALNDGLISRATALKELKERSRLTGRFTNITDEDIKTAEEEDAVPKLDGEELPDDDFGGSDKKEDAGDEADDKKEKDKEDGDEDQRIK